ncbi:UNVERIFIED_CONTAM: putative methyltransferase PMT15 [Sesamum calycinum]|uniref:Methyltransferase n=1 Tax=Sesamum calycinum TaxID=2727403 RepID=A0AAW2T094_9LAMI
MATWATLTHYLSLRTKKTSLYYMALTTVLCSIFYLIGIWQHGGGATSTTLLACNTNNPSIKTTGSPNPTVANTTTLDFNPHHTAEQLVPLSPAARALQFPPCDPKFSEYTPCQDTARSLKFDREMLVYRERHCPEKSELLKCRIPAPHGYKTPFRWPESRDVVWYANVPHKHLTVEKAGQNWVRFEGDRFSFPGGGTMFPRGADAYIDDIGKLINLGDGSIRTAIDTGCGVSISSSEVNDANFGLHRVNNVGVLFFRLRVGELICSRDILPMSFAPKDTHEAQVQFALERGVPALIGIMASERLPYPSRSFDVAHCSRCLIPWGQYDGLYLIEVDRVLRPGGYWILSGPPVNWQNHWKGWNRTREDLDSEQNGIESVARSLCWKKLVQRNDLAIWQKATNHLHCKLNRKVFRKPPFCQGQDPDKAWNTKMEACLTPLPEVSDIKEKFGRRVAHYKNIDFQLAEPGRYRNLLDMNAGLGGFAAALVNDPVWVMNVIPVEAEVNTLGVIYERGLIGTYQSWCEAMSTYPRTYDFIHADSIFTLYKDRCEIEDILLEMDRILRPQGSVIIRDDVDVLVNVKSIVDGLAWESRMTDHEGGPHVREKLLIATKQYWTAPAPDQDQDQDQDVPKTAS